MLTQWFGSLSNGWILQNHMKLTLTEHFGEANHKIYLSVGFVPGETHDLDICRLSDRGFI